MKRFSNTLFKSLLLAVMVASASVASAQYRFGGLLMDRDGMMSNDIYTLSQTDFGFGTARSMAMAGAFTSLGGDLASMGINPAGLGMYRSNEISITPMMGFINAENSAQAHGENSLSRFSMANLGAVINLIEKGEGSLVSLNFGIFNAIRLSDKFDFNIDLRTTMVKDSFDGDEGGRKEEGLWTATFGFSYKFKKRGWDREKTVIRNNRAEADALQKQLDALRAENQALKDAPVVGKVIKEVETSSVIAPVLVLFEIGKADLSNEGRVTLGLVAKAI